MPWLDVTLAPVFRGVSARRKKLQQLHYYVMNGAGNRFVIVDARPNPGHRLSAANIRHFTHSHSTIGCDQLIVMEAPDLTRVVRPDVFMRIYNADGSEVSACGNATRCVAWLLMKENDKKRAVVIETRAGMLACERDEVGRIRADLGKPRLTHELIPAAADVNLDDISLEGLSGGTAVGMGNPHVVFFIPDMHGVDLGRIGPAIEHRTDVFPERVNVSIAKVQDRGNITLRVWERGAGLTQACGTAACATLVAAVKRGLTDREVNIHVPGGTLHVEWPDGNGVLLSGPVELQSEGDIGL